MRHFGYLATGQDESLFAHVPQPFGRDSDRQHAGYGARRHAYSPWNHRRTTRSRIGALVGRGVTSAVLCLEDAIRDTECPPPSATSRPS